MKPVATEPARLEAAGDGAAQLRGALTFETVPKLWPAGIALLATAASAAEAELVVNLAGVGPSDSAGLALLVSWRAQAQQAGRRLRYEAMPEALRSMAQISAVDGFL